MNDRGERARWRSYLPAAQIAIGVCGLLGAIFHAFPIHSSLRHENWPVLDAVDIGWVALIAVAVLLPGIGKLTLGGVSVELREEARESAQELQSAIEEYANLVQNWSSSAVLYVDMLAKAQSDDDRAMLLAHYLRDRMGEAKNYLSENPDDDVRIALWMYDPTSRRLEFFFSNEDVPTKQSYALGEGMLGEAFLERRYFNEADVRNLPSYLNTRKGDPPYRAVLCIPIFFGDDPIGMLTMDKRSASIFSSAAEDIARGLAAQCALAIDQFRKA
ncbi:MAG: GAF domain-containing protein [Candidatus Eremiobacteraeota bacterium]|nr:GAF domain-containing protein [Candidatus Eremiobacteraeota bacterium]